jgi:hypothetical protein
MRLLRAVERLESAAAAAAPVGVGLVWTRDEALVDRDLEAGEYVACDVRRVVSIGEGGELLWCVRLEERVTRDRSDLGFVYGPGGEVAGRVVALDGSLISWVPCALALDPPGAEPAS